MSDIKVGIGVVDYTPPVGLPLMGNLRDDYASQGVHDRLFSRAVVFEDAPRRNKVALLSMDVCMLARRQVQAMRQWIQADCGIPQDHILIAATHTHSGPATMALYTSPKADDQDIEAFLKKAAQAVSLADKNVKEASMHIGYGKETRLSFNRRIRCQDGQTHMNWESHPPEFFAEPLGPIDPELFTLAIEQQGRRKSVLVNFPLHPAIIDYENSLYSADYPGYLAEALTKIVADDFVTLFFNGCCGNLNHIHCTDPTSPRRGYHMAQRVGYMLAAETRKAMRELAPLRGDTIAVSSERVSLKRLTISEENYQWARQALEKMKEHPAADHLDGLTPEHSAPVWVEMYEQQNHDDAVEVMAIRIGDVGVVGLPGEVFCELGLEIKRHSPAPHTMIIELANDAVGYLPTRPAFEQGGYETTPGSTRYQPGAGEKLVQSALDQLNKLFDNANGPYSVNQQQ